MAQEQEPIVRIRELKKDRVNFVLENVDLAYVVVQTYSKVSLTFLEGWPIQYGECVWQTCLQLVSNGSLCFTYDTNLGWLSN